MLLVGMIVETPGDAAAVYSQTSAEIDLTLVMGGWTGTWTEGGDSGAIQITVDSVERRAITAFTVGGREFRSSASLRVELVVEGYILYLSGRSTETRLILGKDSDGRELLEGEYVYRKDGRKGQIRLQREPKQALVK